MNIGSALAHHLQLVFLADGRSNFDSTPAGLKYFLCRERTSEHGQLWKLLLDSYNEILETINNTLHQSRLL